MKSKILMVVAIILWVGGIILYGEYSNEQARKRMEQRDKEIADLSIPPRLSKRMRDPDWSIRYWISIDKVPSDCEHANELMDRGERVLYVKSRKGRIISSHTITEYLDSCEGTARRAAELVDPHARKWCAYRQTDERFATLCNEWQANRGRYLSNLRQYYDRTLRRYNKVKHTLE